MKTRLAVFDIDGTLYDGNLGISFVKYLVAQKVFDPKIEKNILSLYGDYKQNKIEKGVATKMIYQLYAEGLKNKTKQEVIRFAKNCWSEAKRDIFDFTKPLIKCFEDKNHLVILLSGSPSELVNLFAKEHGIILSNTASGREEIINDKYTGRSMSNLGSAQEKIAALRKIVEDKKINIDWADSFGMGDNERDVKILEKTGHSVAFEPNEVLKKISAKRGWHIADRTSVLRLAETF